MAKFINTHICFLLNSINTTLDEDAAGRSRAAYKLEVHIISRCFSLQSVTTQRRHWCYNDTNQMRVDNRDFCRL